MDSKKKRTLEEYRYVGAQMRIFKHLVASLSESAHGVAGAVDNKRLKRAVDDINEICFNLDEKMFKDFPELGDDYLKVFYGALDDAPSNKVDAEQIALAKKIVKGYFGEQ